MSSRCTAENEAVVCKGYKCDTVLSECYDNTGSCENRCASGYKCSSSGCEKQCSGSGQCGNYTCDTSNGVCESYCLDHDDCENGAVCKGTRCVAP